MCISYSRYLTRLGFLSGKTAYSLDGSRSYRDICVCKRIGRLVVWCSTVGDRDWRWVAESYFDMTIYSWRSKGAEWDLSPTIYNILLTSLQFEHSCKKLSPPPPKRTCIIIYRVKDKYYIPARIKDKQGTIT